MAHDVVTHDSGPRAPSAHHVLFPNFRRSQAFRGDALALDKSRDAIREAFIQNKDETEKMKIGETHMAPVHVDAFVACRLIRCDVLVRMFLVSAAEDMLRGVSQV